MQHERDRWVDPFHGRAGSSRPIGGPVGKLAAYRPCITKSGKLGANLCPGQTCVVAHARIPLQRPTQRLHQLAGQAKRKVEAASPNRVSDQPGAERIQRGNTLQSLEQQSTPVHVACGQHNLFAPRGAAGKITPNQQSHMFTPRPGPSRQMQCMPPPASARPGHPHPTNARPTGRQTAWRLRAREPHGSWVRPAWRTAPIHRKWG